MNQKELFTALAERIISETTHEQSEIDALIKPVTKLMVWAYTKGLDAGIQAASTDSLENAV